MNKANKHTREYQPHAIAPRQRRQKIVLITHKYRGSIVASFVSKSVEPTEELKVEQIFPQVLSTTDTTLRTLDVRFTGNKYETRSTL